MFGKWHARGIDVLQGSRIASGTALSGGMPVYKYVSNRILTFFENIVFSLSMTDYHSGMLLYSRQALDSLPFGALSSSFDFDLEVIAVARSRGLSIAELPIPTRYAGEISHVNVYSYGLRVLRVHGQIPDRKVQPVMILVTGGTGAMGSVLVRKLAKRGHRGQGRLYAR